jgi:hypothetical protein
MCLCLDWNCLWRVAANDRKLVGCGEPALAGELVYGWCISSNVDVVLEHV